MRVTIWNSLVVALIVCFGTVQLSASIAVLTDTEKKVENIKYNHMFSMGKPDKEGYYNCFKIHTLEPVSKLNLLHQSEMMMSDFIVDSVEAAEFFREITSDDANGSGCPRYNRKMSTLNIDEKITYTNANIICIKRDTVSYGAGAAHTLERVEHFVYDRNSGMRLGWNDLFKDGSIDAYVLERVTRELASQRYLDFVAKHQSVQVDRVLMYFKDKGHFTVVPEGLKIQYNEYEIASYSEGQPSLIIPKEVLKKYMVPKMYEMCFSKE